MSARTPQDKGADRPAWRTDAFDDEDDFGRPAEVPVTPLTRVEAQALLARHRAVSPWFVLAVQAAVGGVVALLAALVTGHPEFAMSALYGAAVVVVPGALMARGMTSPLTSASPGVSAVSVMLYEMVKIGASVAMLVLARKLVQPLSWPVLLVAMVLCMQVYWLALRWRAPTKRSEETQSLERHGS